MSPLYLRQASFFPQGINRHSRCPKSPLNFAIHPAPHPSPSTHLCATPSYLPTSQTSREAHPVHRANLLLPRCTASIPVPKGEGKTQSRRIRLTFPLGGVLCLGTELPPPLHSSIQSTRETSFNQGVGIRAKLRSSV